MLPEQSEIESLYKTPREYKQDQITELLQQIKLLSDSGTDVTFLKQSLSQHEQELQVLIDRETPAKG